jgi:S-layer protein (TIGR01564 family)
MEVKKAIKRIVALAAGATMLGATMFSALAAADLANYPAPFVQDGKFDAFIVVGDKAAAEDVSELSTSEQVSSSR